MRNFLRNYFSLKMKLYILITMATQIYYERFNMDKLKQILACNNFPIRLTGSKIWAELIRSDLEKYRYKQQTTKGIKTVYTRKIKCFGRWCSSGTIQHMPRELRNYGCEEYYVD